MVDEIMTAVASALAEKGADAALGSAPGAWGALVRLVRRRLARDGAAGVLQSAQARPADEMSTSRLTQVLERMAAADPAFAQEVRALWPRAMAQLSGQDGALLNVNMGTVGDHLIQGRDLHIEGDLSLGAVRYPPS
jgi:hypothetical protein